MLDIDILLWSGGAWGEDWLIVPPPERRARRFVLEPLAEIAPDWRDPLTGATVRHSTGCAVVPWLTYRTPLLLTSHGP